MHVDVILFDRHGIGLLLGGVDGRVGSDVGLVGHPIDVGQLRPGILQPEIFGPGLMVMLLMMMMMMLLVRIRG